MRKRGYPEYRSSYQQYRPSVIHAVVELAPAAIGRGASEEIEDGFPPTASGNDAWGDGCLSRTSGNHVWKDGFPIKHVGKDSEAETFLMFDVGNGEL
ncbi:MAG: hypothetical protein OEY91_13750 [Nitrospirota bacterium]|nr:hypothetical protein [Nitrospirota bacterium]